MTHRPWIDLMETVAEHRVVQVDTVPTGLYTRPVSNQDQTLSLTHTDTAEKRRLVPGLVLVWTPEGPSFIPRPVGEGLLIGRGSNAGFDLGDAKISRRHCTVHRDGAHWLVTDEGSHNGTRVDGVDITGTVARSRIAVIRIGHCLFLPTENMLEIEGGGVENVGGLIIGPRLRSVQQEIRHKGRLAESLHISGESGVGKENAARLLHDGPATKFVAINCAEIPSGILERTLFGSRKGAFTGAEDRVGLLQTADGGTLFLDEIGELPLDLQPKLLRVLENGEYQRVGETQTRVSRARILAATNRDLRAEIRAGRFRADLYHRLSVFTLSVPPLRDMDDDRLLLLDHFRRQMLQQSGAAEFRLDGAAQTRLAKYHFPGNVRELRNIVVRLLAKHPGETLNLADVEAELDLYDGARSGANSTEGIAAIALGELQSQANFSLEDKLRTWENGYIEAALKLTRGNVSQAARLLGINRTTLYNRMELLAKDKPPAGESAPSGSD